MFYYLKTKGVYEVLFVHEEKIFGLPDFFRFKETPEKDVADKDKIKKEIESKLTNSDCLIIDDVELIYHKLIIR
jgi:hypothetical protein